MKYCFLSLLFISNIVFATKPTHDMPLAFFDLIIEKEEISLTILFDKNDLEMTMAHQSDKLIATDKIEIYLLQNMTWIFNEKKVEIEFCTIEQIEDHYQIKARFFNFDKELLSVKIINTCLVDVVEKHSNILNVEYQGKQRTFRMHKGRKETFFEID